MCLQALLNEYPDDEAAEKWFVKERWKNGIACPHCGGCYVQESAAHPDMRYRCRGCRAFFSVRTGRAMEHTHPDAILYTDEWNGYKLLPRYVYSVNHERYEYARGPITTNRVESLWECFKRSYKGIYYHMSRTHMQRYVNECWGRLNMRPLQLYDKMGEMVRGMDGKPLTYTDLRNTPVPVIPRPIYPDLWLSPCDYGPY